MAPEHALLVDDETFGGAERLPEDVEGVGPWSSGSRWESSWTNTESSTQPGIEARRFDIRIRPFPGVCEVHEPQRRILRLDHRGTTAFASSAQCVW